MKKYLLILIVLGLMSSCVSSNSAFHKPRSASSVSHDIRKYNNLDKFKIKNNLIDYNKVKQK